MSPVPQSRRTFLTHVAAGAVIASLAHPSLVVASPGPRWFGRGSSKRPHPSVAQLNWQRDELALFLHFGVNTFTDREWGDGKESPSIFNPTRLDARQWARAAKAAGAKSMILTAKHHDGFCLWPTKTTMHSVASSPWKGGRGDVVREFVEACRSNGLKPGLYCSPWDRNHAAYGDSPRYNDVYAEQLTELLTEYGPITEVWFDGANGEGPNGKRQAYDWKRNWALVRKLQPNAVIFSDAGPDVRWIGNENGVAGETNWSTIRPESVPFIGADGPDVMKSLQEGHPDGSVWRPGETDVSIRPGWFYHPAEDAKVKTIEQLIGLYFTSVGRNSKLLLNVPPTRDGLLHDTDVTHLTAFGAALDRMFNDDADHARPKWKKGKRNEAVLTMKLKTPTTISIIDLREDIEKGQRVSSWTLSTGGAVPTVLARGTTIGNRLLRRITPVIVSNLQLNVTTIDDPEQVALRVYA